MHITPLQLRLVKDKTCVSVICTLINGSIVYFISLCQVLEYIIYYSCLQKVDTIH
jgi:hypothetical protein